MAHWNYRVMKHTEMDEPYFAIHEVHYATADDSKVMGWTDQPVSVGGENLKWILERMLEAQNKPVLDYKTGKVLPSEP